MNPAAKFDSLSNEVRERLSASGSALVVAHFPATLDQLRQEFEQRNLSPITQERRLAAPDFLRLVQAGQERRIILVQVDALAPDEFPGPTVDDADPLTILVAERHFLPVHDKHILDFA